MDVVPVNESEWSHHPFSGAIVDAVIFGRGTQDMKGVGFVHYAALKKIKDEGIRLKRTVHLVLVPDEEVGGFRGLGQFVETDIFKQMNVGYVLDEGLASGDEARLKIKVAERKVLQIKIVSSGDTVHGSRLHCANALHELILFLGKIAQFQKDQRHKNQAPGLLLSTNMTSLSAGIVRDNKVTLNAVPGIASATIDIRVPLSIKMAEVHQWLNGLIKDFSAIHYSVENQVPDRPSRQMIDSPIYRVLEKSIASQGLHAEPYYAEETTDLRFYEEKGLMGLGLTPFTIKPNIHGIDECVRISDLEKGVAIFADFLKMFCLKEVE
jgi:aminoacylase